MNTAAVPVPGHSVSTFYVDALRLLEDAKIPFLIGGAFAQSRYTNRDRDTKDLDIVIRREDVPRTLNTFQSAGFETDIPFPHWLAKIHWRGHYMDVVFGSGNGIVNVDDAWFEHAMPADVLGARVWLCPPEEMVWSKAFIQERERFDGADVLHLLHACAPRLDWDRLLARFGEYWPVLLSHLVLFGFAYPDRREDIPVDVMNQLTARLRDLQPEKDSGVCYGTLLSREQYLFDLSRLGYADARLEPHGQMTSTEADIWTQAIESKE